MPQTITQRQQRKKLRETTIRQEEEESARNTRGRNRAKKQSDKDKQPRNKQATGKAIIEGTSQAKDRPIALL